jgi:large subunit ribosomal protein L13
MDYIIDAKNKKLGRLASEIALILQGKKSPKYNPRLVGDDRVILKNYKKISFDEYKLKNKKYYRHSGYVGHLQAKTLEQVWSKNPKKVILEAVRRMLPKNKLNSRRLKNIIFED